MGFTRQYLCRHVDLDSFTMLSSDRRSPCPNTDSRNTISRNYVHNIPNVKVSLIVLHVKNTNSQILLPPYSEIYSSILVIELVTFSVCNPVSTHTAVQRKEHGGLADYRHEPCE